MMAQRENDQKKKEERSKKKKETDINRETDVPVLLGVAVRSATAALNDKSFPRSRPI